MKLVTLVTLVTLVALVALVGITGLGACGGADDRPQTLAYITQTILAPTCAAAECHSAFKREVGDQFDTVDATRRSMVDHGLVTPGDPVSSLLIQSLTTGVPSILDPGGGDVRMPLDAPIPDADVQLIAAWITAGAPGAQCVPGARGCSATAGGAATLARVVECSADGDATGAVVQDCAQDKPCVIVDSTAQCIQ
jgi:hypothetical protein